jgi:hypothetical protein
MRQVRGGDSQGRTQCIPGVARSWQLKKQWAKNRVHGGCNDAAILLKLMKDICAKPDTASMANAPAG